MRLDGNARVGVDDAISVRIGSYAEKAAGLSMGGAASLTSNILNLRLEGGSSSYGADLSKSASLAVGDLEIRDCAYGLVLDGMAEAVLERYVADADAAVTAKRNSNVSIASGFTTLRESVLWEEDGARISVGADENALVRFTGYARQDEEGDGITLRLGKEGSFWNVTRSSSLSELSVHDGAALRFFFTTDETRSFRGARGEGEDAFVVVQGEKPVLLAPGADVAIVVDSPLTLGEELRLVKSGAGFAVSEGGALRQLEADADLNDRMSRTDEGDAEALSIVVPLSTLRLLPYELDSSQVNLHLRGENLLVADITALTPVKPVPDASLGVWTKGRLSQFGTVAAADDLFLDTLNQNRAGRFGLGPFAAVRAGRLRSKGIFSADVTTGLLGLAASIGTSVDDAQAGLFSKSAGPVRTCAARTQRTATNTRGRGSSPCTASVRGRRRAPPGRLQDTPREACSTTASACRVPRARRIGRMRFLTGGFSRVCAMTRRRAPGPSERRPPISSTAWPTRPHAFRETLSAWGGRPTCGFRLSRPTACVSERSSPATLPSDGPRALRAPWNECFMPRLGAGRETAPADSICPKTTSTVGARS